jgi:hypothetical protein
MQPQYMRNLLRLPIESKRILERKFQLPRRGTLFFRLLDAHVDHAQATMTLLGFGDKLGAEILLGHPITVCPPCLSQRFHQMVRARTPDEDKFVIDMKPNPYVFQTASAERPEQPSARYARLKVGMTLDQALRRGVTRRDLREWAAAGTITIGRRSVIDRQEAKVR